MQTKGGNGTCLGGEEEKLGTSTCYHITGLGGEGRGRGVLKRVGKGQKRREGDII